MQMEKESARYYNKKVNMKIREKWGYFIRAEAFLTCRVVTKGIKADCNHLMRTATPTLAPGGVDYFSYILFAMLLYIRSGENGGTRYFVTIDMREISPY